jgi:hypothetical protein
MLSFNEESFEVLAGEVAFCLANIRHPDATLQLAGPFYEDAAEALRGHAILRLLIDGDGDAFSNDLVMSAQARRAYLRRCAQANYADHFIALSRSGSLLDAVAGDDPALAAEISRLSPTAWRPGEEYEVDFCFQRLLALTLVGAPAEGVAGALEQYDKAAEGSGARLRLCRVIHDRDAAAFDGAFRAVLAEREAENQDDKSLADERLAVALGTKVFVEGIAVLKIARRLGLPIAMEYPMCPALALLPREPAKPEDEFAIP